MANENRGNSEVGEPENGPIVEETRGDGDTTSLDSGTTTRTDIDAGDGITIGEYAERKKRGRKPGSKNAAKNETKKASLVIDRKIACKFLESAHGIAASKIHPSLRIEADEAALLTNSVIQVADQYKVTLDTKTQAWIQLGGVMCLIYLPRIYEIMLASKKRVPESNRQSELFDFTTGKPLSQ